MNKVNYFKNWTENGNNYILKGNPKNRWVGFQKTVLEKLIEKFDDEFNIIIWTDKNIENDYYCIPFGVIKHLFIDEHKTTGKYPNRWTSIILNHQFLMHSNTNLSVDLTEYYAKPLIQPQIIELDDDYLIENAKALINFRLGQ